MPKNRLINKLEMSCGDAAHFCTFTHCLLRK